MTKFTKISWFKLITSATLGLTLTTISLHAEEFAKAPGGIEIQNTYFYSLETE